ncbi:MAG: PilZ domain-containing protein [Lachnospiraceae bacterium]|nr:PilZ domain-containing protein [Lachnospiraceae bacterium]
MPHNRRESYRCFVGIPSSVQLGPNHAALPTIIRDISISGFAIVCDKEFEIEPDRVIHVLLKDYLEELSENFIYELYGHVARTQQLENGKFLYGCRLNNTSPQLDAYIMKKERLRLKKTHGGK